MKNTLEGAIERTNAKFLQLGNDPYWLPLAFMAMIDVLAFAGAVWLAYPLRFFGPMAEHFPLREGWVAPDFSVFFRFGLLAALAGVITYERMGFYQRRIGSDRRIHIIRLTLGVVIANLILQALLTLFGSPLSRGIRLIAFALTILFTVSGHYLLKRTHNRMVEQGLGYCRALLVVDAREDMEALAPLIAREHGSMFQIVGVLLGNREPDPPSATEGSPPTVGNLLDLRWSLATGRYDAVLICLSRGRHEEVQAIASLCESFRIPFYVESALFEEALHNLPVGGELLIPILKMGETPLSGSSVAVKRIIDIAGSAVLIVLCLPLWALLAALIKLESRGPIFYSQERIGMDGRSFKILKFRSMIEGAELKTGPVWASQADPRRTAIGSFMRGWNLDETPQFINVLRGEMSLVGPRPERPHFINQFKTDIPQYLKRHLVKSGITGWAQVNGLRGDSSIDERTRYDMWYIENWSLWLDIRILFLTLFARKNAY